MSTSRPNFVVRTWRFFWQLVSWLRISLLNLGFLVLLVVVIAALLQSAPQPIDKSGPLFIAPSGRLVDQLSYESPINTLSGNQNAPETLIRPLIKMILSAAGDDRITGLIIRLDYLSGGGISKIEEIGQAIDTFKNQGKPVIAYSNAFSQSQYLLAAYADKIYMHDMGRVTLSGFGLYRNYFEQLIGKLGINVNVFKAGTFKDFVEPYTRSTMSSASREHNEQWLNALWQGYAQNVEQNRGLEQGAIDQYINNIETLMDKHNGDTAKLALDYGLVDKIDSKQELVNALIEEFGADIENPEVFKHISSSQYQQELYFKTLQQSANIGLIVAAGNIVDGEQPEGTIGGDSLVKLIRKARNNEQLQGLVIRVDSGGGSAFASELIRQEIVATQAAGKPVYISMGSMAASGGYWLAANADQIWATPSTLTGSIGVFSIIPTFEQSLKKIGVNNDGFATSDLAGAFRLEREMTPKAKQVLQMGVDSIYEKFLTLTAEGRNMDKSDLHNIAEGRVWLGSQAHELGLVDELGSLQDTLLALAKAQNLDAPRVMLIERDLSTFEQIIKNLMMTASTLTEFPLTGASLTQQPLSYANEVAAKDPLAQILAKEVQTLLQTDASGVSASPSVYATCSDCLLH